MYSILLKSDRIDLCGLCDKKGHFYKLNPSDRYDLQGKLTRKLDLEDGDIGAIDESLLWPTS
jgi:hypothetical protein